MITAPQPSVRASAISLVTAAVRDDFDSVRFMLDMCDVDEFVASMHATLALMRALALKLRSAEGLLALYLKLAETSHDEHRGRDSQLAAQLILGHAQTCEPPTETITAVETFADLHSIGVNTFNAAGVEADFQIIDVFVEVLAMWRLLLPEVNTTAGACMVGTIAGRLWAASAEPTPPEPIEGTEPLRIRTKATTEDSPPGPMLAAPPETEVVQRPYRPYQAYLPPGAPVSLRGLAIRRQQERGVDVVYG
jgi:hypothetical protein